MHDAPKEVMRFGRALRFLVDLILTAGPALGTAFMRKVDLTDTHMYIWLRLADVPAVYFLVPR